MSHNKLGITNTLELAEAEERISKKKAMELFDNGTLAKLETGKFESLKAIHKYLFDDIYELPERYVPLIFQKETSALHR